MVVAPRQKQQYDTHFYCALCGGPFAEVFRTSVNPAPTRCNAETSSSSDSTDDTNIENEFNYSGEENRIIPEEAIEADMGYAARRSRRIRLQAQKNGTRKGIMEEPRVVRQAYDGRRISVNEMKWTKKLRAIVHRGASQHPENYENSLADQNSQAYMTGRGLVRGCFNFADAYASVEDEDELEDEEDEEHEVPEFPEFSDNAQLNDTYGFQLYKELIGNKLESFISSIPFHDECESILDLAVEETGRELGLDDDCINEIRGAPMWVDQLWGHLRSLITVSGDKKEGLQTRRSLHADHQKGVITRLGELDYREAESSGEGWKWKHEDGCHWLAADPTMYTLREAPLKQLPCTSPWSMPPRGALQDPFNSMPPEVVLMVSNYLSSTEIFRWKIASPFVHSVPLPDSFYRRFLKEDFRYLNTLSRAVEEEEKNSPAATLSQIDWRGSFERLHLLMRSPTVSGDTDDENYGAEWDQVDISLKNRRRIWRIVKPIAETLVHTSSQALVHVHGAAKRVADQSGLVRGLFGTRSGKAGSVQTTYFGDRQWGEDELLGDVQVYFVRMWTDGPRGDLCGMQFFTADTYENDHEESAIFGRVGSRRNDTYIRGHHLAGLAACMNDGIISGAQIFVFSDPSVEGTIDKNRVGRWTGGVVRKIIAPYKWRRVVGVTGYVNSDGFIETIGLIEQTVDRNRSNDFPESPPPPMVPLSHQEASVWKTGIPPQKVSLREREGPEIPDWRLTPAEWEIWGRNPGAMPPVYCADGLLNQRPRQRPREKTLLRITGYYDECFLRGLEFHYLDEMTKETTMSLMGSRDAPKSSSIEMEGRSGIVAAVINHSDEGVHGILFVNDHEVSEVYGPRYLGTHKVYAPLPGPNDSKNSRKTMHREELSTMIIGLHALYDPVDKRFLQLGLIVPLEEGLNVFAGTSSLRRKIPFDEQSEQALVWDSGPPPDDWIIGNNQMFDDNESMAKPGNNFQNFHDFTGWAPFGGLRTVKIYGNLRGIRFTYSKESRQKDIYFGYVENDSDVMVQELSANEYVVGIAWLDPEAANTKYDECDSVVSATSRNEPISLQKFELKFITNQSSPELMGKKQFVCEGLCGLKFDFNFHHIVAWAPLYRATSGTAIRELSESARFPWKKSSHDICSDPAVSIPEKTDPISIYLGPGIDGIKSYVDISGKPCGILLRKDGCWSKNVFGFRSAYETTFDLNDNECITGIFAPEVDGKMCFEALAFSTNQGRTSQWVGQTEKRPLHRIPPKGHTMVGLFAAYRDPSCLTFDCAPWDVFGMLYRPSRGDDAVSLPRERYTAPEASKGNQMDKTIDLPCRLSDMQHHAPQDFKLLPMALARRPYFGTAAGSAGRAWSLFNPAQLRQIRVWPGASGIKGIRFKGDRRMGIITVGEWPENEDRGLSSADKMSVAGPEGERISCIKLAFQRVILPGNIQELRLIGLSFETTLGRLKTIVSPSLIPENPRDLRGDEIVTLKCPENGEIWGLHAIFTRSYIHDLGLAVRKTCCSSGAGGCSHDARSVAEGKFL